MRVGALIAPRREIAVLCCLISGLPYSGLVVVVFGAGCGAA